MSRTDASEREASTLGAKLAITEKASLELKTRLMASTARERAARNELSRALEDLTSARAEPGEGGEGRIAELQEQLSRETRKAQDHYEEWEAAESRTEALEKRIGGLEADLSALTVEIRAVTEDRDSLSVQLTELGSAADEQAKIARSAGNRARKQRGGLENFLSDLLPRVRLDPDSIDTISALPDPRRALKVLIRLQEHERLKSKTIKGRGRWLEVDEHIQTGESGSGADMCRIYYLVTQDSEIDARVHRKKDDKEQERYFSKLA